MTLPLPRLWPENRVIRLVLLALAGLGVLSVVLSALWAQQARLRAADSLALRVAATVSLLADIPGPRHRDLFAAVADRETNVMMRPSLPRDGGWQPIDRLDDGVSRHLARTFGNAGFRDAVWIDPRHGPDHRFGVAVRFGNGHWIIFAHRLPGGLLARPPVWIWLAAALAMIAIAWSSIQLTRPLRRMAEAMERLPQDPERLAETGPRELRATIRSFNRMSDRVHRLVRDRTLTFAATCHDIRTLLTRLRLRAEFIEDGELLARTVADTVEMDAILESTLVFAREDAQDDPPVPVDLARLLRDVAGDDPEHVSYDGPVTCVLPAHPVMLRRMVANLVSNACRYGDVAEIALRRRTDTVEIVIDDRGPGIPTSCRDEVFTAYYRPEGSPGGGSGLGLAIVLSAVEHHAGTVRLENRTGGGLRVRVTLPATAGAAVGEPAALM